MREGALPVITTTDDETLGRGGTVRPVLRQRSALPRLRAGAVSTLLVAPLVLFLLLVFVLPLGGMLVLSVANGEVRAALPAVAEAMEHWNGAADGLPDEAAHAALAQDLKTAYGDPRLGEAGRRLNYERSGYRALIAKTARAVQGMDRPAGGWAAALPAIDPRWGEPATWAALRRASPALSPYYLLAALDLRVDDGGSIVAAPADERLYVATLGRTLWIGAVVTLLCLALGYPLAHALVSLPRRFAAVLMMSVLLPFWTSLLVRTSAWIVVLQKEGVLNGVLTGLGLVEAPLDLVFNRIGLCIAMVHILLPFMVLPILSVMKGISPTYMKASASLGAHPLRGFLRIYLPLTLPGVGAGCLMTFIIGVGYYITPSLVGGARDQMTSYFIAYYANTTINWGLSSALGAILLACIMLLYATVGRLIGVGRIAGIQ
jgi:putative spermidine/putrescine transport system permease protein